MSRAYCLTCNEPVHETPNGTCPLGHPVSTHDHGPEPWVGFAGDEQGATSAPRSDTLPMERLDADGRPAVPAGRSANGSGNGHASLGGGHGHGDPFPSAFGHRSSFASGPDTPPAPTERAPAAGAAADDLAAMLADALGGAPEVPEATEEPVLDQAPEPEAASPTRTDDGDDGPATVAEDVSTTDWDDLTSLAAELRLDASTRDDGPAAPAPSAFDEDAVDATNIDDLLAELTGGLASDSAEPPPPRDEPTSASPPPPPPPVPTDAVLPPPPPPGVPGTVLPEPANDPADGAPMPTDDVASAPPAPEPVDLWADPTPAPDEATPADTTVDLANFTARGRRVGEAGPGGARKKRGWKR